MFQRSFVVFQNQNMSEPSKEQGQEQGATGDQLNSNEGSTPSSNLTGFKPVTIRAKENTKEFFSMIESAQNEHKLNTTEASTKVIAELLGVQARAKVLHDDNFTLVQELEAKDAEIARLKAITEAQVSDQKALKENEIAVFVEPRRQMLFERIANNRFKNDSVRARYKLQNPESIGDLLMNCITTQEILFNYNECFYTGLTKSMVEDHQKQR